MQLTDAEYDRIYKVIETSINAVSTPSNIKKLKHNYFLDSDELETVSKAIHIVSAEIRQNVEKAFIKFIENYWDLQAAEEAAKRKQKYAGRGRRKKDDVVVPKEAKTTTKKVGGLKFGTVE